MFYFAYGGNTNSKVIMKNYFMTKKSTKGKLLNHKLVFRKVDSSLKMEESYCDVEEEIGSYVEGIIYTTTKEDILKFDKQEKAGQLYERELVDIEDEYGNNLSCYMYKMINRDFPYGHPSIRYYKMVLDGYTENLLPISQIVNAVKLIK
jgi:hypothetical protein